MTVAYDTSSLARFTGAVRGRVPLLIGAVAIGAPAALAFDAGLQLGEDVMQLGGPLSLRSVRNRLSRLLYDRRFGVSTADFADLADFGLDHPERVYYSPAHWGTLLRALPKQDVSGRDVFVDLGAGKGRMALEAASRYPFGRVIGVELSAELTEVARANLAGTRLRLRAGSVEFVNSDVLDFVLPDDASVVFLNNPFRGEIFAATMDGVIASADRRPRPITVIYFNPVEEPYLLGTGRFRHVRTVTPRRGRGDGVYGTTRVYEVVPAG
ncbi:class I SAM-dependent methyltransferase [Nonomuraea sp. SBT364]|uniref:class I SAM-dependent methyltransferase n=1 Tax=Nonomuraea sp. SBT364 TaxID=1580530 RepID=UPI000AC87AB1|nr:class I SAM-dependent methyltransferase [Nonomuraea sp. SBT364]